MIGPRLSLPGRVVGRRDKPSRLAFHWRASDGGLVVASGQTMSFQRVSGSGTTTKHGWGFDAAGRVIRFGTHQPIVSMHDLDQDGVPETAAYMAFPRGKQLVPSWDLTSGSWSASGDIASRTLHRQLGEAAIYRLTPTSSGAADPYVLATLAAPASASSQQLVGSALLEWNPTGGASGNGAYVQGMLMIAPVSVYIGHAAVVWSASGTPSAAIYSGQGQAVELRRVWGNVWRIYLLTLATTATTGINFAFNCYGSDAYRSAVLVGMPSVVECPDATTNFLDICGAVIPPGYITGRDQMTCPVDFDVFPDGTFYTESIVPPFRFQGYNNDACATASVGGHGTGNVAHILYSVPSRLLYNTGGGSLGPVSGVFDGAAAPATPGHPWRLPYISRFATQVRNLRTRPELRIVDAANPSGGAWSGGGIDGFTAWGSGGIGIGCLPGQNIYQLGGGVLGVKVSPALLDWPTIQGIE